jgi:23S rRNA (guanine745-N1)-methyltransferase
VSTETGAPGFRCPVCRRPLADAVAGLACEAGHRFDRAREGYVNLLPARPGRRPAGDDADAVRARRALLDRGHYAPVVEAVAAAVAATGPRDLLDAGCGEGTYLAAAAAAAGARGWGIDVSKAAVRLAARRFPEHRWAVASSLELPFGDGELGTVVSVFAPRAFAEFRRVLRPGGAIVLASPGPDHLAGVRALLGRDARSDAPRRHVAGDGVPPPSARVRVTYTLALTGADDVRDLVAMTPWHTFAAGRELPERLDTTVDVWVTTH